MPVLNTTERPTEDTGRSRAFPIQEIMRLIYKLSDSSIDEGFRSSILKAAGCPPEVLAMPPYELSCYFRSHTKAAAFFLMILELSACRICDYYTLPQKINSYRETARLFLRHYLCRPYEQFTAIASDRKFRLTDEIYVSEKGNSLSAEIPFSNIIRYAITSGASYVILAHNHPVSQLSPSQEDTISTRHIAKVLGELDITLADHIIISGTNTFSMRLSGEYTDIFGNDKFYKDGQSAICSFSSEGRTSVPDSL